MNEVEIYNKMVGDPKYAVQLVFDNNPTGFRQSFALVFGQQCTVEDSAQAIAYAAKLVQNPSVDNAKVARALLSVPFNALPGNYTGTQAYARAIYRYSELKNS